MVLAPCVRSTFGQTIIIMIIVLVSLKSCKRRTIHAQVRNTAIVLVPAAEARSRILHACSGRSSILPPATALLLPSRNEFRSQILPDRKTLCTSVLPTIKGYGGGWNGSEPLVPTRVRVHLVATCNLQVDYHYCSEWYFCGPVKVL